MIASEIGLELRNRWESSKNRRKCPKADERVRIRVEVLKFGPICPKSAGSARNRMAPFNIDIADQ